MSRSCLATVIRYNGADAAPAEGYHRLWLALHPDAQTTAPEAVKQVATCVEELMQACGLTSPAPTVQEADINTLADMASQQWTARFNPRPTGEAEFRTLFTHLSGAHP